VERKLILWPWEEKESMQGVGGLVSVAMGGERNTWEVVEDIVCNLVERRVNARV
jgi:hypothetical protein